MAYSYVGEYFVFLHWCIQVHLLKAGIKKNLSCRPLWENLTFLHVNANKYITKQNLQLFNNKTKIYTLI